MRPLYIFNVDSTLTLLDHRRHLAQQEKWDKFYDLCDQDEPNPSVINILNLLCERSIM